MCDHPTLKTVNCKVFCLVCGAELPPDTVKNRAEHYPDNKQDKGLKKPKKGAK